jgi:stage II sporulation protein D
MLPFALFLFLIPKLFSASTENPLVKVRIMELSHPVQVLVTQSGHVHHCHVSHGHMTVDGEPLASFHLAQDSSARFQVEAPPRHGTYAGSLDVFPDPKGKTLVLINTCRLADYVLGVTASEIGQGADQGAYVRALGTVVLSFALENRFRHKKDGYDFCDYTHCQVFKGLPQDPTPFAKDLEGIQALPGKGHFFSRCCGGQIDRADWVWGKAGPASQPLLCRVDGKDLCASDPLYRWQAEIPWAHVEAAVAACCDACEGPLLGFEPSARSPAGRLLALRVSFQLGARTLDAARFFSAYGKLYGWNDLHSLNFTVAHRGEMAVFEGKGDGHGVGLCQSGALELARRGWSSGRILDFYFP